jgi:hypothetical protein
MDPRLDAYRIYDTIDAWDRVGNTVGHTAAKYGHADILAAWLSHDVDYTYRNRDESSIGEIAVINNYPACLQAWLSVAGCDEIPDHRGTGTKPLSHFIAQFNGMAAWSIWREHGGPIDRIDDAGRLVGHVAASHGHYDILQAWMRDGGDVHARDASGYSIGGHMMHAYAILGDDIQSWTKIHMASWIRYGGCILGDPKSKGMCTLVASIPHADDVPGLVVTHTALRHLGHPVDAYSPSVMASAFRSLQGHAMAERILPYMKDPVAMALFIQDMGISS